MAQHHRTGSSGFVISEFQPTEEDKSSTDIKLSSALFIRGITIVARVLDLNRPSSFDTPKVSMLMSAKLLRF